MAAESDNTALQGHDDSQAEMMSERCILVDSSGNSIGSETKLNCHFGDGQLHRAFSVLIFDSDGRMLVQKRSDDKITFPSVWANSCCSHPLDIPNENEDVISGVMNAAKRKLHQELGISDSLLANLEFMHLGSFLYECRWDSDWIEREVDHVLVTVADGIEVQPNPNEISSTRWIAGSEIDEMMAGEGFWKDQIVAPWFRLLWGEFFDGYYPDIHAAPVKEGVVQFGEVDMGGNSLVPGQNLLDAIGLHREHVEKVIMRSLSKMKQERLHGAMTHLFSGGGKRLRATLPRLVGEAVGEAHEGHYTLGASIEIIHNFTLVHDDLMDQDPIRRGLEAVHVAYDDSTAINAGDAMLAVAFEILAESPDIDSNKLALLVRAIGEMVRNVADGQQEDISFESRDKVSEAEYIAMITGKTSVMFETCAGTGSILAGASPEIVENMEKWGLNLGLCFQLMDDLIDITGDTKTLGKPAGSDIVQGKKTLIAIHALQCEDEMSAFTKAYGSGNCSDDDLLNAVKELHDSGSIQYAKDRAMHHHALAHECLDKIPDSPAVSVLRELTDFQLIRIN
ncbi:MAG: isopentenyl-diphosphate delta-isomerase [Candidatus Thermoplasmatota archaeon]|nr:isopentenyl-diphosphate delta-isomerase [Candidatus Thermoplasmatota archaeon]